MPRDYVTGLVYTDAPEQVLVRVRLDRVCCGLKVRERQLTLRRPSSGTRVADNGRHLRPGEPEELIRQAIEVCVTHTHRRAASSMARIPARSGALTRM